MLLPTTLHDKIYSGKPTIGTHILMSDPDIPELIGDTGLFDYAEFSAEYSTVDAQLLYHLARSAQCGNLPLIIKLDQESQGFWAQMAIGAGFQGVLFTDIRSPSDVDICCKCVRPDTPSDGGHMGVKLRRPALGGYQNEPYLERLNKVIIMLMLEKETCIDNLESVLTRASNQRVAMTQWGPADFSLSRGTPSLARSEEIWPFEEQTIRKSIEAGVAPRVEIRSVEQAKRYIDLGVQHFCIGWDRFILQAGLTQLGEGLRALIE